MDFSKHIQRAEEALRRKNYDYAIELFRQLLDLDADLGAARAGLRRALLERHKSKPGGKLLRAVGGAMPLVRAKTLAKLGRHGAAAEALEDFLAHQPLDPEANLLLGQALESAGHLHSAAAVFEFLAEIAPRDPEGLKRAGDLMRRMGQPQRALEYFERALQVDPRDRDALKARKDLAAETALDETGFERVAHSRELARERPREPGARAQDLDGRRHRSEEELRAGLGALRAAAEGGEPAARLELAGVLERLGELDEAEALVGEVLASPGVSAALLDRAGDVQARVYKRRIAAAGKGGDEARATRLEGELRTFELTDLRRRLELHPGDAGLRLKLGRRLLRDGELDAAAVELQRANADPRLRLEALFLLGQCFQRKGILDLARNQYAAALEGIAGMNDRKKEILYNLAAIAEAEGDAGGARAHYSRIYEVDIGYRDVAQKMELLK